MVHGCFMVGNLNETPASMEKTLSFAKKATTRHGPVLPDHGLSRYDRL